MSVHTESTFEAAIVAHLTENDSWILGDAKAFDRERALFPEECWAFLEATQADKLQKLHSVFQTKTKSKVIDRLCVELEQHGMLHVIRHGITVSGLGLKMAYFKPESGLNPENLERYQANRLQVTRQVHYSTKHENSLDLTLSLNGLPVATLELKNPFTGQNVNHAQKQYAYDRDPNELMFRFRHRTLVHFAVDPDEVYMTTQLAGKATRYLPFNKGYLNGAGNPPANEKGYKTWYLWEETLQRDSWLDILGRYLHFEKPDEKKKGAKKVERLIFPRYHQLDAVRELSKHACTNGAGHNYLIQHSAGSGKSNSIAWLAYRLSNLHDAEDKRVFDSVVVVTDLRVLDQQLQNTIYQFEHKTGVVEKIDKNSEQLKDALISGKAIIITTLHKFPVVYERIAGLPNRRYAVIVDEAHSSQGGESTRKMKDVLSAKTLEEAEWEDGISQTEDSPEDMVRRTMESRGKQANISFFAFTATPKYKTLAVFGTMGEDERPRPFHLYSMRQAIEEKFILDVLRHYCTYGMYFRLSKAIEDDPELNKRKAAVAIGRFVSLHPHNIAQKTEIIIEHFRTVVRHKIGGKAKAMVVTGSRLHALRYYLAFKTYLKEKGYADIVPLVAFSGKVMDPDSGYYDGATEAELNGFGEKELPERFEGDDYRILIVADKYQTGFDQPLLHTMYVDKRLSGVKAVQTLSRLNRMAGGKEDTFVLDFVNDRDEILKSFQPYFESTTVDEPTDPDLLYTLKHTLDQRQVYWQSEIDSFVAVFFRGKEKKGDQAKLYQFTQPAVDRYKALEPDDQDEFKKQLGQWLRLYSFLAQLLPFPDPELEKFYAYGRLLNTRLPAGAQSERLRLEGEVNLQFYRLEKASEGRIIMEPGAEFGLSGQTETGLKRGEDEHERLSKIIDIVNDRFGTEFTEGDQLFFDSITSDLVDDAQLQQYAQNNTLDNFELVFDQLFLESLVGRMDQNQDIFDRIVKEKDFGDVVRKWILKQVYDRIRAA